MDKPIIEGSVVYDQDSNVNKVRLRVTLGPAEGFFDGYIDLYGHLRLQSTSPAEVQIQGLLFAYLSGYEEYIVERIQESFYSSSIFQAEFKIP